jgi:hypothetical protein
MALPRIRIHLPPLRKEIHHMSTPNRTWSQGRVAADDDGDTSIAIAADPIHKIVRIQFSKPMLWIGFDAKAARQLAAKLIEKADQLES